MPLRSARAVLFDLDGVLIDSFEVWFRLLGSIAADFGYPEISREVFRNGLGQGIEADARRFFPGHTLPELERLYAERFPAHLSYLSVPAGVPEVFAALRRRGTRTAVITNTPAEVARPLVERAGATPDVLVGGTDVARPKPAPDMVVHACARLGVPPGSCWVVGDTVFDSEAARGAGAHFAGLGTPGEVTLDRLEDLLELLGEAPGAKR